jgi:hypothetical protein
MKFLKITTLCLILAASVTPALALGPLDASADLALNSKYVWRGMTVNPEAVLQPEAAVSFMGFGAGFWGNIDMTSYSDNDWKFNEIDYFLTWDLEMPLFSLGAGLIYYDFPNTEDEATTELYITASAGVLFSPTLTIYQDIDQVKGAYWEAGISHGVALSPAANLELSAGLGLGSKGYLKGYFDVIPNLEVPDSPTDFTGASMCDYYVSAGVPFESVPFLTITPSVTYASLVGDAKDSAKGFELDEDAFYYGITASFSF